MDGTTLTLTYGQTLDANSVPATSAFAVRVSGTDLSEEGLAMAGHYPVTGVDVSGNTVTLTLSREMPRAAREAIVSIWYTPPASNPIQNPADHDAKAFGHNPWDSPDLRVLTSAN